MVEDHRHTGTDSARLFAKEALRNAPQNALTNPDNTALSFGGTESLTTLDSDVIDNMRTRINEIETALRAIGLIL